MAEKRTVCLDLGHGQETCSMPKLSDLEKDTGHGKYTVERLNVAYQKNIIPTQFILTNEQKEFLKERLCNPSYQKNWPDYAMLSEMEKEKGEIPISDQLPASDEGQERFSFFKVCPGRLGESYSRGEEEKAFTYGVLMACFVYASVKNIIVCNDDKLPQNREEIQLLVGCPTTKDWTSSEAKEIYANLIKKATGIDDVRIVPESRAAMFSAVGGSANSEAISTVRGAIVFDFGSSTADCTYMLMGRKIIEFSWTLGAHHIEENMTNFALANSDPPNFIPSDSSYENVLDNMRRHKENYYNGLLTRSNANQLVTFDNGTDEATWVGKIDETFMETMVGDEKITVTPDSSKASLTGSWKELCRAFFEEAKDKIEAATYEYTGENGEIIEEHCTVENIVLTGGASQMPFIEALCKEVFSDEQIAIMRDPNPGYTVSNGLAWVSISDDHRDECVDQAKAEVIGKLSQNKLYQNNMTKLKGNMVKILMPKLKVILPIAVKAWAKDPNDLTKRDLAMGLSMMMEKDKDIIPALNEAIKDTFQTIWKDANVSELIIDAVNNQSSRLFTEVFSEHLTIPKDVWSQLNYSTINMNGDAFKDIIANLDMMGVVGKVFEALLTGIVVVLFSPVLIYNWLFGDDDQNTNNDNQQNADMDEPISKKKREKAAKNIAKLKDSTLQNNLLKGIGKSMANVTDHFNTCIGAAIEQAIDIVMLRKFSQ